jgi:AraC-like DNA-binding protein/mannose-6-phosphate isomerase-like protein (cupin superfamily)
MLRNFMPETRQIHLHDDRANDDNPLRSVLCVAHDRPERFSIPAHSHLRAQLVYAADGVMRVSTVNATWVVPPQQAVWVPSGVEHSMSNTNPIALRTLYLHPQAAAELPRSCCVLTIPPLLREMILYATALDQDYSPDSPEARLMSVIPDLLSTLEPEPLQLPLPVDRRLRTITDALIEEPAEKHSLANWAEHVGASERTLSRHFRSETGISFHEWRQRLHLLLAITHLSEGDSVTSVAYDLGYESPSAFIAMFRRKLGFPPMRYIKNQSGNTHAKNIKRKPGVIRS